MMIVSLSLKGENVAKKGKSLDKVACDKGLLLHPLPLSGCSSSLVAYSLHPSPFHHVSHPPFLPPFACRSPFGLYNGSIYAALPATVLLPSPEEFMLQLDFLREGRGTAHG